MTSSHLVPRGRHSTSRCRPSCPPFAPRGARSALPGLLVVAVATAVAFGVNRFVPAVNPSTVAVVLGAVIANAGLHRPVLHVGTHTASHRLLRLAVVLLGLQLGLPQLLHLGLGGAVVVIVTVTVTFLGTRLLGRLLGVSPARSLLIATGFSICGASAVAAMEETAGGDDDDTAVAVALVTLCGSLAILVLPLLRAPLSLDPTAFGSWVGASVHDVGQTVATANRVPGALTSAVIVKLSRVVLLAPLVAGISLARRRRATSTAATRTSVSGPAGSASSTTDTDKGAASGRRRPPLLPLFVAGFLAAIVLASTGWLPDPVLHAAKTVQGVLLAAALVGLGTGIHLPTLRRTGGRALVLGMVSWLLVAAVAYVGVRTIGR